MPQIPTHSDLVADFETFLRYLEARPKLPLTAAGDLKGVDLYALNERVNHQSPYAVTSKSRLADYPLLAFIYQAVTVSRLAVLDVGKVQTLSLVAERVESYRELTEEEKYVFLLETAWCYVDWSITDGNERGSSGVNWFQRGIRELLTFPVGIPVAMFTNETGKPTGPAIEFPFLANNFVRAGEWFGWYVLRSTGQTKRDRYSPAFDQITLTEWGQQCLFVLAGQRPFRHWNKQAPAFAFYVEEPTDEVLPVDVNTFAEPFRTLLDEPELVSLYPVNPDAARGVFWFRVELPHHKVSRTIAMSAEMPLNELHFAIQDAFSFENDHLYRFYLNPRNLRHGEQYISPDEAEWNDGFTADSVTLGQLNLYVGQRLLYVFDLSEQWEFLITVTRHLPDETDQIVQVVEQIGEAPQQYVDDEGENQDDW